MVVFEKNGTKFIIDQGDITAVGGDKDNQLPIMKNLISLQSQKSTGIPDYDFYLYQRIRDSIGAKLILHEKVVDNSPPGSVY